MKKLFLTLLLLTTSIYASDEQCAYPLLHPKLQLTPYIYEILNSSMSDSYKLQRLRKLIGVRVEGWHRSYPEGQTYKQRTHVIGTIEEIIKIEDTDKEIYQMTVVSKGDSPQQFLFSGSYSPAFSTLETYSIPVNAPSLAEKNPLFWDIRHAEKNTPPFDLLSIGLDTPPEVAEYKESLHSQRAVVFDSQSDPFHEFANSYKVPIIIYGEIWPSSEHYLQAKKFIDLTSDDSTMSVRMNIRIARSPADAAKIGRSLPIRSDWERIKNIVMLKVLAEKFTQHKHLYDLLMSTEDALIVKHTEKDRY